MSDITMSPEFAPSLEQAPPPPSPKEEADKIDPSQIAPSIREALQESQDRDEEKEADPRQWEARKQTMFEQMNIPPNEVGEAFRNVLNEILNGQIPGREKLTPELIVDLMTGGLHFHPEDVELDEEYQQEKIRRAKARGEEPTDKFKALGAVSWEGGKGRVTIYPAFATDPLRKHVLLHELNHLVERAEITQQQPDGTITKRRAIDRKAFVALIQKHQHKPELDPPYIGEQAGQKHYYDELIPTLLAAKMEMQSNDAQELGLILLEMVPNSDQLKADFIAGKMPEYEAELEELNTFMEHQLESAFFEENDKWRSGQARTETDKQILYEQLVTDRHEDDDADLDYNMIMAGDFQSYSSDGGSTRLPQSVQELPSKSLIDWVIGGSK